MPGPLNGVRVLDLTHVLNGPFCTVLLAHMGAEVLKVEYGDGDRFRHAWMPPDAERDGYEFIAVNSNKKGIVLDLKKDEGKDLFRRLVQKSDVVVENFTTGTMDRLGLGYETLRTVNPRIIYACSRGFGEDGPYKHVRANAVTIAAMAGWAHAAMEQAEKPGIKGPVVGDEAAGVSMALGIVAALFNRAQTGIGQKIEVSMQEALLGFMVSPLHTHFEGRPIGMPPKQCSDGYYAFHVPDMTDDLWTKLVTAFGRPELASDPRFSTVRNRRNNYAMVEDAITQLVRGRTRAEVWSVLKVLGLSSGPVLSLGEVVEDEHLKARGAFVEVDHPEAGKVTLLAPWIRFSETPASITSPAPLIGQHNREVFGELLRLTDEEIAGLEQRNVIARVASAEGVTRLGA